MTPWSDHKTTGSCREPMREMIETPVLIVGGGPVGLALAGEIGWRGTPCVLVEKSDSARGQPKMDLVHPRTMEFCRRWGIVDQVEAAGYNRHYSQDYAWVTGLANGYELGREAFPPCAVDPGPEQSPVRRERCPQNFFDAVLARHAKSYPHVQILYETEMLSFSESEEGVTALIEDKRTGERRQVRAQYLAACDGGGGRTREQLGVTMHGKEVLTYTTNAIFRCEHFEQLHRIAPAYRYIFIGPEGTWATIVAINGGDQWRFSFVGNTDKRALSEAEMRAAIERAVGRKFDFEILSMMPWVRRELIADGYGTRRVFLVGDAAHQLSPTGGFGMNTGIQEAIDIGWKLDAMVRGWGGLELPASYDAERRPVAARNVAEAATNLKRMLSPRDNLPPKAVFEHGPEGNSARKRYGDAYTQMMKPEWFTVGIQLGFYYENSPIVVPDGTPPPPLEVSTYTQTSRPGSRAPHVWLEDGRSTLDLFGRGFVLLRLGFDAPLAGPLVDAAAKRGVPLTVIHMTEERVVKNYERHLVLVRPDGHVAWRGDQMPADALAVIDRVRGM